MVLERFFTWLGSHELTVLLAVAGIAAGVWGFAEIADQVRDGDTQSFDQRLLLAMRHPGDLKPLGPLALQEAARDITALGSLVVISMLTGGVGIFLALCGKKRMAAFACGAVASGVAINELLKQFFQRPRPDLVPYATIASSSSFPSGHSMMAAVAYLSLGALLARTHPNFLVRAFFLAVALLITFLVGVSRVYLGVHWPSDVLAGWTAGAVWAMLCWLLARRLQLSKRLEC